MAITQLKVYENMPLAPLTTLKLGGRARFGCHAASEAELNEALRWASERKLPVACIGGGSNLVVSDCGFDGLVIRLHLKGHHVEKKSTDRFLATVAAGEVWDGVVAHWTSLGLKGAACLSGIPGLTGATPIQNVGAYGEQVSDMIVSVSTISTSLNDAGEFEAKQWSNPQCEFSYRSSLFKRSLQNSLPQIVTSVSFELGQGHYTRDHIKYPELRAALENKGDGSFSAELVRDAVRSLRAKKSMLAGQIDENSQSVGSFFTNPTVSFERIKLWDNAPTTIYVDELNRKVPAAWLIENAGFSKGYRLGEVGISTQHALALVHHGGGTTKALVELASKIRDAVWSKFSVKLMVEPMWLGSDVKPDLWS